MSDEYTFGSAFKELRELRGLSLKEAARDIVSPQFLSQFEKGKKGISLENFSRLLISIGVDWADYLSFYKGERTDSWNHIWGQLSDSGIHYEQYFPKTKELLKDKFSDNPEHRKRIITFAKLQTRHQSGNFTGLEKEIEELCAYFKKINYFSLLDIDLAICIMSELPLDIIEKLKTMYLEDFRTSFDYNTLTNTHNSLLFIIGYYTDRGYYRRAQELIDDIKQARGYGSFRTSYDMMMLEREEAYLLLKQNKKEALPKARRVYKFFKLMRETDPNSLYYSEALPQFLTTVNKLNKTGEELFPVNFEEWES
ncbi:MAG: helix-turn-helix transcriptional regulator [Streptococcus orisratti]|uniref:helix-turn-helix domain-containing protein n=1 Tax=Streptococcus orisratti TaxID=114652 RepID=UPI002A9207AD|nr:helix-turn-helix transcriptional regulator [Streptococcus orisratti]MDY5634945.1 helix-turn-helix transcriptional regulator [Streptococcus orisratti]